MTAPGAETFRTSAEAYDRHVGRYAAQLATALIAAAGVQRGDRVLDVGCGPGGLTTALADVTGADHVTAVDPSEPFAAACAARVPGARVEVATAEELPFADDTFDATLSQLVLNFMRDAVAGMAEMTRVTCAGGTVAAAVWDYAGEMTLLRTFWDAAVALDPDAAALDEGRSMSYAKPDRLAQLWSDAGMEAVKTSALDVDAGYSSFDDLWQGLAGGAGPAGAYAAKLPPERGADLRAELRRRLDVGDDPFRLRARAWCVVGSVP
jgi:SAM-dependent methyltransferase